MEIGVLGLNRRQNSPKIDERIEAWSAFLEADMVTGRRSTNEVTAGTQRIPGDEYRGPSQGST